MNLLKAGLKNHLSKVSHLFNEVSETVALRIPMQRCPEFLAKLQEFLINEEGVQSITREPDQFDFEHRLLLLNKTIQPDLQQLPAELKEWVEQQNVQIKNFKIVKDVNTFTLESAIAKVISDESIDPHVKIETVQAVKIIDLTQEQSKFKNEIASLLLERSGLNRTTSVLERRVEKDNAWFFAQSFSHLAGDQTCKIDLQEGSCRFSLEVPRVFFRNFFQEERDNLLARVAQNETIVDLFGEIILDTRLVKERNAQLQVFLPSSYDAELFATTKNNNQSAAKSLSKSLSQPSEQETVKGNLETFTGDLFDFIKNALSNSSALPSTVFISEILKDLSIICAFVGVNDKVTEGSSIAVHFYLLVSQDDYEQKSVEEIVINQLNAKATEISAGSIETTLFEKKDLGSVSAINFDLPKRKLLSVNLTLRSEVLAHQNSLLSQVSTLYKQIDSSKLEKIQPAQDLQNLEGALVKKPKV